MVTKTWTEHEGTLCAGLNWERFSDLEHALVSRIHCLIKLETGQNKNCIQLNFCF